MRGKTDTASHLALGNQSGWMDSVGTPEAKSAALSGLDGLLPLGYNYTRGATIMEEEWFSTFPNRSHMGEHFPSQKSS